MQPDIYRTRKDRQGTKRAIMQAQLRVVGDMSSVVVHNVVDVVNRRVGDIENMADRSATLLAP